MRDRLCTLCNTTIGNRVETQFLRAGPIAFFRWLVGAEGRDGPPPSSPFHRGAGGAPPLLMFGRAPGEPHDLLWDLDRGTEEVFPLRQVVFEHPLLGTRPVPILDRMRGDPEVLQDYLQREGLGGARPIRAFAAADEIPWVSALVSAIGGRPPAGWAVTQYPAQRIQLEVRATVTEAHVRAVAKIGFHYTLKMWPDLAGTEPEFDRIRGFVWEGTGGGIVRQLPHQFMANFATGRPTHWMHILGVRRDYQRITAYVQCFAGPRCLPPPFEVEVGRDPARVMVRPEWRAHMFVYTDPMAGRGVMADAQPANRIIPARMVPRMPGP